MFLENFFRRNSKELPEKPNLAPKELKRYLARAFEVHYAIQQWVGKNATESVSIGENCNSSWYIKETGNKIASYPFDWIFSSPKIVIDAIQDNFETFLNKSFIEGHPKRNRAAHTKYHSSFFNHRNPLNSDADYEYYERGALRFRKLLDEKKRVIFVCTVLNESEKRVGWYQGFMPAYKAPEQQILTDFSELITVIRGKNPNARFLFLEQYTEVNFSLEIKHTTPELLWIRFDSLGSNTGVKYTNETDDLIAKIVYSGLNDMISADSKTE